VVFILATYVESLTACLAATLVLFYNYTWLAYPAINFQAHLGINFLIKLLGENNLTLIS